MVGTAGPTVPLQDAIFLETGEEDLPICSLQPARSELQTQISCGLMSQAGEHGVDLAPQSTICMFLYAQLGAIVVEIETYGR